MATVPKSASNLTAMNATKLQMVAINKTLATESVLNDCYENLSGAIAGDKTGSVVPNSIFMKVNAPSDGTHEITFPMLRSLQEKASMGNAEQILGNEENLRMKHLTVWYNEIKKSVAQFGWGIDYNDINPLNIYAKITELFTRFYAELRGRRIRQALLLVYAEELTKSPISKKQRFTPNIFMCGRPLGGMPSYPSAQWPNDPTNTYVANVNPLLEGTHTYGDMAATNSMIESIGDTAELATAAWATPATANLDVDNLLRLEYYVSHELLLEPIMMDGQPSYPFTIPAICMNNLLNPTVTKSLGTVWKDVSALTSREASIPLIAGRVGSLLLVKDSRYPTLTIGGANGDWTIKVGFQEPGRFDGRDHSIPDSTHKVLVVGFVHGQGALIEWTVSPLKYATESTEYGQLLGKGAYMCAGIQQVIYDEDVKADGSFQQNTSCAVFMTAPTL